MSFAKYTTAAAVALSMMSAPVLASPVSSVASSRAGVTMQDENQLGGGFIIPLFALAAIIAGILVVLDNDEEPTSP